VDTILRAGSIYVFLLLVFRLAGKRTLGESTTFDFVLLLLIAETTQQAILGDDHSLTASFLAITTLIGLDIGFAVLKARWKKLDRWLEGTPLILVENGRPLHDRMKQEYVDEDDVLTSAREHYGLESMDQIRYAVLERSGGISIIPKESSSRTRAG
jgi:uncharacterized membrane protein YcaP (DUF421 family)